MLRDHRFQPLFRMCGVCLVLIGVLSTSVISAQRTLTLPPVTGQAIPAESLLISGFTANPMTAQPRTDLRAGAFTVNTTLDSNDKNLFDDKCKDLNGTCSLRAAVQQANMLSPGSTITVPAGTYTLTINDGSDNATALYINTTMTIKGAGAGVTIIDGNHKGTIFNVSVTGDLTVRTLTITNGKGLEEPGPVPGRTGGGAFIAGKATFERVLVTGNTANAIGGIAVTINGTLTMTESAVVNNMATGGSTPYPFTLGGIGGATATITLTNTTISGNDAADGAGIGVFNDSVLTLNNVTIADNAASVIGGGLEIVTTVEFPAFSTIHISNSIVAKNTAPTSPDCKGNLNSTGDNLFSNSSGCGVDASDIIAVNHGLSALKNSPNSRTPTHALKSDSPAVDSANPSTCLTTDQRRQPRIFGAGCDIGAYELATVLVNGDMEIDANTDNLPDDWLTANLDGDQLDCINEAYQGSCAFKFRGGSSEKSKLTQTVDLTGMIFKAGDVLNLKLYVKAPNAAVKGKVKLKVGYTDGTSNTIFIAELSPAADYTALKGTVTLASKNVAAISVQFMNKSATGQVSIDAASLILNP